MHGTLPRLTPRHNRVPLTLRLAFRELRAGLGGFVVFLACIALGVAAIAGVASISRSLTDGLGREGKRILGGDLTYSLINREATPDERAALDAQGIDAAGVVSAVGLLERLEEGLRPSRDG